MKYVTITIHAAFTDDVSDEEIQSIAAHAYVQVEEPDGTGEGEQTLDGRQYTPAGYVVNIGDMSLMMSAEVLLWQEARERIAENIVRHRQASYFADPDPAVVREVANNL